MLWHCSSYWPTCTLISAVLSRTKEDRVHLLLIAPFWQCLVFGPAVCSGGFPWEIPVKPETFIRLGVLNDTLIQGWIFGFGLWISISILTNSDLSSEITDHGTTLWLTFKWERFVSMVQIGRVGSGSQGCVDFVLLPSYFVTVLFFSALRVSGEWKVAQALPS